MLLRRLWRSAIRYSSTDHVVQPCLPLIPTRMNPRRHKAGLLAFTLFLFASSPFLPAADGLHDPLWRKAIAVASTNADWVPGLVVMRSEVLRKGTSQGVHEMWQRST